MYPQQYKLTPAAYNAAKRRTIIAVPILLIAFALPFAYTWYTNPVRTPIDWTKGGVIAGMIFIFVIIRMVRLLQKQKIAYNEFVIAIDNDRITGKNLMHQDIDFAFIEVTQIVKHVNGSYIVVSGPQNSVINIPADIENKEQLEASLNSISPILVNPTNWFSKYFKVIGIVVFAVLIVFIYSRNKIVIGVSTPILLLVFTWIFLNMRAVGGEKKSYTLKQIIGFSVIMLCILAKAFFVLSGRY